MLKRGNSRGTSTSLSPDACRCMGLARRGHRTGGDETRPSPASPGRRHGTLWHLLFGEITGIRDEAIQEDRLRGQPGGCTSALSGSSEGRAGGLPALEMTGQEVEGSAKSPGEGALQSHQQIPGGAGVQGKQVRSLGRLRDADPGRLHAWRVPYSFCRCCGPLVVYF